MSRIKVSKRYAKALFEFAAGQKLEKAVYDDMCLIDQTCRDSHELITFLKNPVISVAKKLSVMEELFAPHVGELTMKFIRIISKGGREDLIHHMATQYVALYKASEGIKTATLKTASPLDKDMKAQLSDTLSRQLKAKVELQEEVVPDLLGGFVLSVDGKELDASVRSKLFRLKKNFESNFYLRKY